MKKLTGKEVLGIEFGSTRIKTVLIDSKKNVIASGSYEWENELKNRIWTYSKDSIINGLQSSYQNLNNDCINKFGSPIKKISSMGISAMMHGLIALDENYELVTDFRTWRNSNTTVAALELSKLFNYNIPERWSIAHLYQAILDKEKFVSKIKHMTTLAGYVHYLLSGEFNLGIDDCSGMFPIDNDTLDYNQEMILKFESIKKVKKYNIDLKSILPEVKVCGSVSGYLSKDGALLLDSTGNLESGVKMCPAEGDAGTGMIATNSINKRTSNISAGTSIFLMVVLEETLKSYSKVIDIVLTPNGNSVAMVHCNNCSTYLNNIFNLFRDFYFEFTGVKLSNDELYPKMFELAKGGESNCGNVIIYPYISSEQVSDVLNAKPMIVCGDNSKFTLANLARSAIYSCFATLKIGMNKLEEENVKIDIVNAHDGLFKSSDTAQMILASFLNTSTAVCKTASEGGAWGIALLADYLNYSEDMSLDEYLNKIVFANSDLKICEATPEDIDGINEYMFNFIKCLDAERLIGNFFANKSCL